MRLHVSLIRPMSIHAATSTVVAGTRPGGATLPAERHDHVVAVAGPVVAGGRREDDGMVIDVEHFVCINPTTGRVTSHSVPAAQVRPVAIMRGNMASFQPVDADGNPGMFNDGLARALGDRPPTRFRYRNHAGRVEDRVVIPLGLEYKATEHHPEPGWVFEAYDLDRRAERSFALSGLVAPGAK